MIGSFFALLVILIATLIGIPLQWISIKLRLPLRRWIPMLYHRIILFVLGIRVEVRGTPAHERPLLFVSNHSSWIDILALSSITPLKFIAKSEVAAWPLFGLFAKLQRTVFVDRSRRQATVDVNREIASRLSEGDPVVLFGEGTSSDGTRILPFRSALLGATQHALGEEGRSFLQPVSIAYTRLHGLPMGRQHRAIASWRGHMSLVPHLSRVIRIGAIDAVVTFGTVLAVEATADRKALALSLEDTVRQMHAAALAGGGGIARVSKPLQEPGKPVSLVAETR